MEITRTRTVGRCYQKRRDRLTGRKLRKRKRRKERRKEREKERKKERKKEREEKISSEMFKCVFNLSHSYRN